MASEGTGYAVSDKVLDKYTIRSERVITDKTKTTGNFTDLADPLQVQSMKLPAFLLPVEFDVRQPIDLIKLIGGYLG